MSALNPKFVENIQSYDPDLYKAVSAVVDLAYREGGALDRKTRLLIAIALDALDGSQSGVASLTKKAKTAGANDDEIREAIRMAYYIAGMKTISAANGALE